MNALAAEKTFKILYEHFVNSGAAEESIANDATVAPNTDKYREMAKYILDLTQESK